MQIGMMGLGRMGKNMAERIQAAGHRCVVYNRSPDPVRELAAKGAVPAYTIKELVAALSPPKVVWLMLPAAVVDSMIDELSPLLSEGDIIVDGGNSHYEQDIRRDQYLEKKKIYYLDVGTSGGSGERSAAIV